MLSLVLISVAIVELFSRVQLFVTLWTAERLCKWDQIYPVAQGPRLRLCLALSSPFLYAQSLRQMTYMSYMAVLAPTATNLACHPVPSSLLHFCPKLSCFISCTLSTHFLQSMQNYCKKKRITLLQLKFSNDFPVYFDLKLNLIWLTLPAFSTLACCCVMLLRQLCVTPWAVAHQAPLSMGFSRQECWSGLPWRAPGDLPDPGIKSCTGTWVLCH